MKPNKSDKPTTRVEYDEAIMNELLAQPEVQKSVLRMTARELEFFKRMLVAQGTYARYVQERESKS